jgi:hypothetical protein
MSAEEVARLCHSGEQYFKHMLVAAAANFELKEFKFARAQYMQLAEMTETLEQLGASLPTGVSSLVARRLMLPEMIAAGLMHKTNREDGST